MPVTFVEFGDESDVGAPGRPPGYPIPPAARTQPKWIEGGYPGTADPGGDRHMLIVDRNTAGDAVEDPLAQIPGGAAFLVGTSDRSPAARCGRAEVCSMSEARS